MTSSIHNQEGFVATGLKMLLISLCVQVVNYYRLTYKGKKEIYWPSCTVAFVVHASLFCLIMKKMF